ncbi:hypothetical protein [Pseudoduganella violaceinigra]|uniref:hypothetical protein n=1 Tax=Pseudoduganella violaceinigra TaxID=246602 RepID=UPI0012B51A05|nr:hypothetical protein [Pseudoduganella violaceinigra]
MESELKEARAVLVKARMEGFQKVDTAYLALQDAVFPVVRVPINSIEPIVRAAGVHTFVMPRAMSILEAIKSCSLLPPVMVYRWATTPGYEYKLYDGFHRYYLSLALGFSEIFVSVNPCERNAE